MPKPKHEHLTEDQFSKFNGAHHRLASAQDYFNFVRLRISEAQKLQQGDLVMDDGRILRAGRDDKEMQALRERGVIEV